MRIAIGADHRGMEMCETITHQLKTDQHEVLPLGVCNDKACDYPDMAYPVAMSVARGEAQRGILVCGTGIGMCITANKIKGVRAAAVNDEISAEFCRRHNDTNVLCLSGNMLSERVIERVIKIWLETEFEQGRHARRVDKITAIEDGFDPHSIEPIDSGATAE